MIDTKKIESAIAGQERAIKSMESQDDINETQTLIDAAKLVLGAKVPEKRLYITPTESKTDGCINTYGNNKYSEGFNSCHDQFTALIARDYVHREQFEKSLAIIIGNDYVHRGKLPTVERLENIILNRLSSSGSSSFATDLSTAIREEMEKGKE